MGLEKSFPLPDLHIGQNSLNPHEAYVIDLYTGEVNRAYGTMKSSHPPQGSSISFSMEGVILYPCCAIFLPSQFILSCPHSKGIWFAGREQGKGIRIQTQAENLSGEKKQTSQSVYGALHAVKPL